MNIAAVVVTYNRKVLVLECLNAILQQSHKVNQVFLIDNNSTDGTYEYLKENKIFENSNIVYKKLEKNIGGAGGFFEGMKMAREMNFDWVWIMDDDTIPMTNCLENLLKANQMVNENISFLASTIYSGEGRLINVPSLDNSKVNGEEIWHKYLKYGMIPIKEATFVSLIINGEAMKKCGLPLRDYFIWGDDTEYTNRLTKNFGRAYLVGASSAIHKTKIAKSNQLLYENDIKRIKLYYYSYRNNCINAMLYRGWKGVMKQFIKTWYMSLKIIFSKSKYKMKKIFIIHKGVCDFVLRKYDYKAIKNRFNI